MLPWFACVVGSNKQGSKYVFFLIFEIIEKFMFIDKVCKFEILIILIFLYNNTSGREICGFSRCV